jgi:hypothetical protein
MVAASGPPTVDVQATCRASEKDLVALFGTSVKETTDQCVKQENDARERIKKDWATYSPAAKQLCVQPRVYAPSYVEWLTCLEMSRDVERIRTEEAKAAQATPAPPRRRLPNARIGSGSKQCPIVQFRTDGSIASVINC